MADVAVADYQYDGLARRIARHVGNDNANPVAVRLSNVT